MNPCLPSRLFTVFAPVLVACGQSPDAAETSIGPGLAAAPTPPTARARERTPRSRIELTVDGQPVRATVATSLRHTYLHDPADPRFDLELTSSWLDGSTMGQLRLDILQVAAARHRFPLGDAAKESATLILSGLPGLDGARWRSVSGSLELDVDIEDPRTHPVSRASGTFDGLFQELLPDGNTPVQGGRALPVSGSFQFQR
jgi:hypothetical protein